MCIYNISALFVNQQEHLYSRNSTLPEYESSLPPDHKTTLIMSSSASSDDDDDASALSSDGDAPLLDVAAEPDDDRFVDNYAINDEYEHSLSERIVHYVGGYVQQAHWVACKATLAVFHAGGAMTSKSMVTNKAAAMENYCLRIYNSLVGSLDLEFFTDDARRFFLHSFKKKDQPMTAHALFRNYNDCRSKMRSVIIPLLPANYATMKSGDGFHETFTQILLCRCISEGVDLNKRYF